MAPGPLPPGMAGIAIERRSWPFADFNAEIANAVLPSLGRAARRLAAAHRPDAVLAFGIWSMPAALAAARDAPVVLDLAHIESATARETRRGDPRRLLLRTVERWAARRAARLWTVSAEDRARLLALVPEAAGRTAVISHGVDGLEPLPTTPSGPVALFAGRMSYAPNRLAAEFLARDVAPRWMRGRIVLAGDGVPPGLRRAAGVEVVASPPAMAPLYAGARLACAPVFTGSGVRNKALEAARYGVPLVATARAVEGLGFEPSVDYLRAETAGEYLSCFDALLDDPELGRRLVGSARARVTASLLWESSAARAREELARLCG